MSDLISKELLSLVLGIEVLHCCIECNHVVYEWNKPFPNKSYHHGDELNLDTLGRLCKEWCLKQRYSCKTWQRLGKTKKFVLQLHSHDECAYDTLGDTELEAIIKATEFIAKEKELI